VADCEIYDDEEEKSVVIGRSNIVIYSEADTVQTKCNKWLEVQNEVDAKQLLLLRKICNMAPQKIYWHRETNSNNRLFNT
jgi:hypothetical protein